MRAYGWLIFLFCVGCCPAAFQISWFGISGGGGTSSSGSLVMDGTAGQPAAGVSGGGALVLNGGYEAGTCGCLVNLDDLAILGGAWLADDAALNLSGDIEINWYDFVILAQNWLGDCPAGWPVK